MDASVNATQEMLTLGLCNIFGSFVSSMPTTGAFTRSAVSSASGVQTSMAGLYSGKITLHYINMRICMIMYVYSYRDNGVAGIELFNAVFLLYSTRNSVSSFDNCCNIHD